MRIKKRTRRSRIRGKRTCGGGARKKRRGKGSRAGKGRAGTGKMAGHRKIEILKKIKEIEKKKKGFKSKRKKFRIINISDLNKFENSIRLIGWKVLGKGELKKKLIVEASSFSKKAEEKIKKRGGEAIRI